MFRPCETWRKFYQVYRVHSSPKLSPDKVCNSLYVKLYKSLSGYVDPAVESFPVLPQSAVYVFFVVIKPILGVCSPASYQTIIWRILIHKGSDFRSSLCSLFQWQVLIYCIRIRGYKSYSICTRSYLHRLQYWKWLDILSGEITLSKCFTSLLKSDLV